MTGAANRGGAAGVISVSQIGHAQNYPPANCQPAAAAYLQIYPPNQTTPIYLGYTSTACSKPVQILTVSVVQPGSGSSS